jgi:hypothetical protein
VQAAKTGAPGAGQISFDAADSSKFVEGFYHIETEPDGRRFRWTGSARLCKVRFPVTDPHEMAFRIVVGDTPRDCLAGITVMVDDAPIAVAIDGEGPETALCGTLPERPSSNSVSLSFLLDRTFVPSSRDPGSADSRSLGFKFYSLVANPVVAREPTTRRVRPQVAASAHLHSIGQELRLGATQIRSHYQILPIFDQLVKFEFAQTNSNVLLVGNIDDSYYAVQIRNILREECGVAAPLVEIELLAAVDLQGFDTILICYNKASVDRQIAAWKTAAVPPIIYLDDLISKYHWLISVCGSLNEGFKARDVVRGLLGEPVEETRALQFDGWNALRAVLEARNVRYDKMMIYGSGCGLLPVVLRKVASAEIVVYESDPVYLSNLRLTQAIVNFGVRREADFADDLLASNERRGAATACVILCDSANRVADPEDLAKILSIASGPLFLSMFVSSKTKPAEAAVFRRVAERNIAFNPQYRRDLRCYGTGPVIWLPREKAVKDLLGTSKFNFLYETNEYFASDNEYASAYLVIEAAGGEGGA